MKSPAFTRPLAIVRRYRAFIAYKERERRWLLGINDYLRERMAGSAAERPCPLCGSSSSTPELQAPILDFVRCTVCGLVYAPRTLSESALKKFYEDDPWYQESWKAHYQSLVQQKQHGLPTAPEVKTILAAANDRGKCLDIGCGFGSLLFQLKPHFREVEGVEPNVFTAKVGAELLGITIHNASLEDLMLEEGSYDCIVLNQVIEHLFSLNDLVTRVHRLLKPGGILYIGCPTMGSVSMRLFRGDHIHIFSAGHINLFDAHSVRYFANKYHFRIKADSTDNTLDIDMNDLLTYCFRRDRFVHRDNLIPFLNAPNLFISQVLGSVLSRTRLLSRLEWGSYREIVLEK